MAIYKTDFMKLMENLDMIEGYSPLTDIDDQMRNEAEKEYKKTLKDGFVNLELFHKAYDKYIAEEHLESIFASNGGLAGRYTYGTVKGAGADEPGKRACLDLWVRTYGSRKMTIALNTADIEKLKADAKAAEDAKAAKAAAEAAKAEAELKRQQEISDRFLAKAKESLHGENKEVYDEYLALGLTPIEDEMTVTPVRDIKDWKTRTYGWSYHLCPERNHGVYTFGDGLFERDLDASKSKADFDKLAARMIEVVGRHLKRKVDDYTKKQAEQAGKELFERFMARFDIKLPQSTCTVYLFDTESSKKIDVEVKFNKIMNKDLDVDNPNYLLAGVHTWTRDSNYKGTYYCNDDYYSFSSKYLSPEDLNLHPGSHGYFGSGCSVYHSKDEITRAYAERYYSFDDRFDTWAHDIDEMDSGD